MATEAAAVPRRDLILGLTSAGAIGFPGMVAMSKIAPGAGPAFAQADLAGSWRVYIQRVESSKIAGGTTQTGRSVFTSTGAFTSATLQDVGSAVTTLTTGSLAVATNGSVTGTLAAGAAATADRYEIRGTMRAAKDLITGVVTARFGTTTTHQGLVTMVREVTVFDIAQATYSLTEGQPLTVTVTRSGNQAGTVTVRYAAGGGTAPPGSYSLSGTGILTFGPSVMTQTFRLTTMGDTVNQGDRTVTLSLSAPGAGALLGARVTAAVTILDDDVPGTVFFDPPAILAAETGNASLTVKRTGGSAGGVVVGFRTVDGTAQAGVDYTARNSSVTFAANQAMQTLTVAILPNQMVDGNRAFTAELTSISSGGSIGAPSAVTVTIRDDDVGGVVKIAGPVTPVTEGGPATLTISRSGGLGGGVTVEWATVDITAREGSDYASGSGTVTFAPNETSRSITVQTLTDSAVEGDEAFRVILRNPVGLTLGTPSAATVTIQDAQQGLRFSAPEYRVTEGTPTALITVVRTGPAIGTVTVRYGTEPGTATPGADYTPVGGTLTFGPGVKQATFTVPIANDAVAEGIESVLLTLAEPGGVAQLGPQSGATLWILDNDLPGQIKLGMAAHTVAEAAGTVTVTVQRVGTAGGITVDYRTQDGTALAAEDYLATQGTLTFGPNETTKTFTVRVLSDTRDEPNETFTVLLENPGGGATLGVPASAVVTITDDDVPGVVAFSLPTYTATEAAGRATVLVNRTGGQAGGVTVDLEVTGGAAVEGADWSGPLPARLTFAPGEASKSLAISIAEDFDREGNESIFLRLLNPGGGATLGPISTAAIVITDNDPGPIVTFGAERLSVAETTKTAMLNIVRSHTGAGHSVTLDIDGSASGGRVASEQRTISFATTQLSVPVTITIADNAIVQPDGQVTLTLSSPTGGLGLGTASTFVLSIIDNDATIQFANASVNSTVTEGGTAMLTVERTGALGALMTVRWTTANGTAVTPGDYAGGSGLLTFAPGVASQVLRITTVNDALPETTETFTVTLSAPTGGGVLGALAAATVSITPDADAAGEFQFAGDGAVLEGGVATLIVTRSGGQGGPVVVHYQTQDGTATVAGRDYVAKTGALTFAPGVMSQTVMISTLADAAVEGSEMLQVVLGLPPGSPATLGARNASTLTILDGQTARVHLAAPAYSVSEGAGVINIPVNRLGSTALASTVGWTATPGSALGGGVDYTAAGGALTFAAGSAAAQTITIPITNDMLAEPTKAFTVALGAPSAGTQIGTPASAVVTLVDDDAAGQVQFGTAAYAVVEGGTALISVLRTNGAAGGVEVSVVVDGASTATAAQDYLAFQQTHVFAAGESLKVFTVPTNAGGLREVAEALRLRLQVTAGGAVVGAPSETTLWIVDDVQTVRFAPVTGSVAEGGTATVTVVRSGTTNGAVSVGYRVAGGTATGGGVDYSVGGTGTLSFGPGVASLTFTVATVNDAALEGPETVVLELFDPLGIAIDPSPGLFTLTIVDNERPDLTVASIGAPLQAATGLPLSLVVAVQNLSGAPAPASKLAIFLSTTSDPGSGQRIALVDAPALAGGARATLTPIVNVPPDLAAGDYFVSAVIDALGSVIEETDANNGRATPVTTQVIALRPDLVITSLPSPGNTLSGKLLSTPLHVRNAGPAASGPYRVGVFLSQNQSAGTEGLLLATRDMPGLAPGMGADVPLSLPLPDELAQGSYYVSAVVDLLGAVTESDESNNLAASALAFQVTRNLGKLAQVSASFTTGNLSVCAPQVANQTVDLTGTLKVTTQMGTTGQGTITLDGFVQGAAVRFSGTFSATVAPDDTVTISFTVTSSGAFTGTATATGSGTITDGVLEADVSGFLNVAPFGSCPFTGTLTVTGQTSFFFSLLHFANGGAFAGATAPSPSYPLPITAFSAALTVLFDPTPAFAFQVRFTGPPGSGVTGAFADERQDFPAGNFYETDTFLVPATSLAGTWSVLYEGATKTFTVPNPEAEQRFVAMLPTVTLNAAQTHIVSVSWVYKNRLTGATVPAPLHADAIQIEIDPIGYKSPDFPRTVFSHTFPTPIPLSQASFLYISYKDSLTGNFYVTVYTQ